MQDGCKVYVDSYVASNGSSFMVTWIILKNHLLEVVDLTRIGMDTHTRIGTDTHTRNGKEKREGEE
jgi:hypothetical protein